MKSQHVLILVLVAVVMLYVIATALGVSRPEPEKPDKPDHTKLLKKLDGKGGFLRAGDQGVGCFQNGVTSGTFTLNAECTIVFHDRGLFKRSTKIAFEVDSGSLTIIAKPEKAPEMTAVVPREVEGEDGETETLECYGTSMPSAGGELTLRPPQGGSVQIELLGEKCPED